MVEIIYNAHEYEGGAQVSKAFAISRVVSELEPISDLIQTRAKNSIANKKATLESLTAQKDAAKLISDSARDLQERQLAITKPKKL